MQSITNRVDAVTGAPLAAATVQALVNRQLGSTQVGIQVQVTDTMLNPVPVSVGNNSDPSDITDLIDMGQTCTCAHDTTQPIHRTFSFSMRDQKDIPGRAAALQAEGFPSFPINPYQNFLRLWYIMQAGGVTLKVSLGYYNPVAPKRSITPGGMTYNFIASDLTSLIAKTDLMSDWVTAAGGDYVSGMTALLTSGGIPLSVGGTGQTPAGQDDAGPAIPTSLLQIDQSGNIVIPAAYLFAAQTNRVDAVNTLADGINYYGIWNAPGDGSIRTSQKPYYGSAIPAAGWDYSPMPDTSIIESPISQDFSSGADARICNVVRVVSAGTSSGIGAFSSVQVNTNPNSVVSTVNLLGLDGGPRALVRFENNSKIMDQQMCDLRASILLQEGAMLAEQVTLSSLPNPFHEDHDLLICNVTQMDGTNVIPSSAASLFEEQSWSIDLTPSGRMSHLTQRVVAV